MRVLLFPFSIIYRLIVNVRNKCFDLKILKSESFNYPIITIGNITVGGTGKTPHTEYLINWLKQNHKPAVLSRGYKRKTKKYINVETHSTVSEVGDEPLQMKLKYPDVNVAVDRKRVNGVKKLISQNNKPDLIVLDDAFQHRHIKAGLNILLIDYNKPITKDYMLPTGRLREPAHNKSRANIIIITKCPEYLKPIDFRIIKKELKIFPYQDLFFTVFKYKNLISLLDKQKQSQLSDYKDYTSIILTAIANPKPIYKKVEELGLKIEKMAFADHHTFSIGDIKKLNDKFNKLPNNKKIIICTEKDAVKLKEIVSKSSEFNTLPIHYLPIEVEFLNNGEKNFKHLINKYLSHFINQ